MILFELFIRFFRAGLFAVGGGMATIPFLYEMSDATGWFTYTDLANMIAVSESTPGPIGVNMATYVGFTAGMQSANVPGAILGAIAATLGLVAPSIIIILIIASILKSFRNNSYVNNAFYGLRPASTALIAAAGISVAVSNLFYHADWAKGLAIVNWKGLILAGVLWLLTNKVKKTKGLHPIVFILGSALVGILFSMN